MDKQIMAAIHTINNAWITGIHNTMDEIIRLKEKRDNKWGFLGFISGKEHSC